MKARPLDAFAASLTFALCVVWGFNQVVVKLAFPEVGPIAQTGIRSAIGVVVRRDLRARSPNGASSRSTGRRRREYWPALLFTAEFIALFESLRFTTAARATVFIYAAPFFVALGAAFLLKAERLRPIQWAGARPRLRRRRLSGLRGRRRAAASLGDALALLARSSVGRDDHRHQGHAAQARRSAQSAALPDRRAATVATPPLVYAFGETAPAHLSAATIASLLWQGVAVVGVSYALWFWLLTNYAAPQLSAFTFMTPLVGVFAGWLVFGETVTAAFALAIVLVLAGLALVNWPRRAASRAGPARSWMNCQAVRPEREPRVVAHSSASASSPSRGASRR